MPVASAAQPKAPAIRFPATAPFTQDLLEIDGLTDLELQERFRRLWKMLPQAPSNARLHAAGCALIDLRRFGEDRYSVPQHIRRQLHATGCALIDLRRFGEDRYSVPQHIRHQRTEAAALDREQAEEVRRAALRTNALVRILGEQRDGRVLYRTIGQDPGDRYPAPWYIVAVQGHGTVRAHGADEVEQA
ncbi:hypothetical protein G5C51_05735 [Streptomyces sp. A7024]|uniref:Uncharacterized protein n=1 Tax=Streptomyces coryli TaxID=1128680 RepID=A0A6G4TTU7_9ACTN|nr:hypothetical protein [Streptomyces coryli]NGN63405.1 hypothetical protein [Streptomyces coryli]